MKRKRLESTPVVPYKEVNDKEEKWKRPSLPEDFSSKTHSVILQQMDIQYVMEPSPTDGYDTPVMKMFGCSQEGYSVALSVYNFVPYIYIPMPVVSGNLTQEEHCNNFQYALDTYLRSKSGPKSDYVESYVTSIEVQDKMNIMNYREDKIPFLKITFSSPRFVTQARSVLEEGNLTVPGIGTLSYQTYESDILFVQRYMIDNGIGGASWVELPAGKYSLVSNSKRKSNSTIEATISYEDLVAYKVDDVKWSHNAPLRTLSFDIECAGRPGCFPKADRDPVIQIANYVTINGDETPLLKNIFILDTCTPISGGVDVRSYRTEEELLMAWSKFVLETDPDILTGYNIVTFDLVYLKDRARALGLKEFDYYTREIKREASFKDSKFSSAQTGTRESKEWSIYGRIVFDVYQVVQANHKLSSYKLNNVAQYFLEEQKEDVHHSMITKLHKGSPDDRRRLAIYCLKDAYLPQRLIDKRMFLISYVEMARVTGVPFSFLLSKGQGVKVMSQILRKARLLDLVIPFVKTEGAGDGFEGATVLTPKVGYYDKPIFTLDFASLYPSIMLAHNLCYTTYIPGAAPAGMVEGIDYETSPAGHKFVLVSKKKGILCMILEDLLGARRNARRLKAEATIESVIQVYECRQLALKVSANSVYGFTGQAVGRLPCLQISESVTSYGREMILLTKKTVEEEFCIANGYQHDAEVIYGDTDSVMVCSGVSTVAEAIALGKKGAELVTAKFPHPIKLEFEKVYYPWLLMSKKKYAGLFWTKADKWDKLDSKGIESVRRDNCGIVRHVVERVLNNILIDRDIPKAVDFCKGTISDILQNKIDLSLLIITKSYSRPADAYKSPQAHVVLAKKMEKRDPSTAPTVGDRVPFVIVKGEKKSKMFEKSEDPLYVLENDVPIDSQYYIDQLISPLCRIFGPIIDNPEAVFTTGEHTRKMFVPTPKTGGVSGGLGNFLVIRDSCMGCKAVLRSGEKTLCIACRDNAPDIYNTYLKDNREKEMQHNRLWTHCQSCKGNLHTEVECAANDCPIFYKRTKAHKECVESRKSLAKFDLSW